MSSELEVKNPLGGSGAGETPGAAAQKGSVAAGDAGVKNEGVTGQKGAAGAEKAGDAGRGGVMPQVFKTEKIGNWAAGQEGYFAAQNRKAEEKREKARQKRKKILPFAIGGGVLVAGLVIWGVVALVGGAKEEPGAKTPTIAGGTTEDIASYQEQLQGILDESEGLDIGAVENAVNETLETESGKEYANQVKLAEIFLLQNSGYYAEALAKAENINPEELDLYQKGNYYAVLYYCNALLGNTEKANEYQKILFDLTVESGDYGGAGE